MAIVIGSTQRGTPNGNDFDVTLSQSAETNKIVIAVRAGSLSTVSSLTNATLDGVSADFILDSGGFDGGRAISCGIAVWLDAGHPGNGTFTVTTEGITDSNSDLILYELYNVSQSFPILSEVWQSFEDQADGSSVGTAQTNQIGKFVLSVLAMADNTTPTEGLSTASANQSIDISGGSSGGTTLDVAHDTSALSNSEDYNWNASFNGSSVIDSIMVGSFAIESSDPVPPSISDPTPSGTIATQTSAIIGCTTNTTEGTAYAVVDTVANVSGITGSQIKAGNNNLDAAAISSGNVAVSGTSVSIPVSGLTLSTTYGYAIVHEDTEGFSNVLTGSFTTAAVATVSITSFSLPDAVCGSTLTVNLADGVGPYTFTYKGEAVVPDSQDATSATFNIWDYPWDRTTPDVDFYTDYVFEVTDTGDSNNTDAVNLQTVPASGEDYHVISGSPFGAGSIYFDDSNVLNGDKHWGFQSSGNGGIVIGTSGILSQIELNDAYTYRVYDASASLWSNESVESFTSSTPSVDTVVANLVITTHSASIAKDTDIDADSPSLNISTHLADIIRTGNIVIDANVYNISLDNLLSIVSLAAAANNGGGSTKNSYKPVVAVNITINGK